MNDYKKRKLEWLESSEQYGKSLDEIYENADIRQLQLIVKCFDACMETAKEFNNQHSEHKASKDVIFQFKIGNFSVDINDIENMKKSRKEMCDIINKNTKLRLMDGGVKGRERAKYKIKYQLLGDDAQIDDINRVTVLSDDYELIEKFLHNFNKKFAKNDICAKEKWDMKSFGLLSKSNDVLIDGYPAEVHVNETNQFLLGQALTHSVYEVMRLSSSDPNFKVKFNELPKKAALDLKDNVRKFPNKQKMLLCYLLKDLNKLVKTHKKSNIEKQKDELLKFHRKAYQFMISQASVKWINVYFDALKDFNKKGTNTIEIEPILQRAIDKQKQVGSLSKIWYMVKDGRKRNG